MFSYILYESIIQFPKVITSTEIEKRLEVGKKASLYMKRRIQLFCSELNEKMQEKYYSVLVKEFENFNLPRDRKADLTEIVKERNIPQVDTVVLFSCSNLANKGRKRYSRTGQTSSIYQNESLGGKQIGTLVNTYGIRKGPAFFDSIPNQKAETLFPLIRKYQPHHAPFFSDMGYRGFPGRNHRMINHNAKSPDKRYKWAKDRWSKNGINNNTAEGNNALLKQAFSLYRWINPKYSQLYLNEFSCLKNLKYFSIDDIKSHTSPQVIEQVVQTGRESSLRRLGGKWRAARILHELVHSQLYKHHQQARKIEMIRQEN